jgi:hypothetical protein
MKTNDGRSLTGYDAIAPLRSWVVHHDNGWIAHADERPTQHAESRVERATPADSSVVAMLLGAPARLPEEGVMQVQGRDWRNLRDADRR